MRCTESSSFLPKGSSMLAPFLPHRLSLPTFWPFSLSSYIHRLEFSGCLPSRLNMLPQLFKWLLARWILKSTHFKCEPVCSTCTVQFTNTCLKAQASKDCSRRGWKAGSKVKNTACSSRGPGFDSQYNQSLQPQGTWHPLGTSTGTRHTRTWTDMQAKQPYTENNK